VLSTSRDKHFSFHSTDTQRLIGSYNLNCFTTCLAYDTATKHCFVGDSNGKITFLRLTENGCEFKATLNGHAGYSSSRKKNSYLFFNLKNNYLSPDNKSFVGA